MLRIPYKTIETIGMRTEWTVRFWKMLHVVQPRWERDRMRTGEILKEDGTVKCATFVVVCCCFSWMINMKMHTFSAMCLHGCIQCVKMLHINEKLQILQDSQKYSDFIILNLAIFYSPLSIRNASYLPCRYVQFETGLFYFLFSLSVCFFLASTLYGVGGFFSVVEFFFLFTLGIL